MTRKGNLLVVLAVATVAWLLPACVDLCGGPELAGNAEVAADRALSCVTNVTWEGRHYEPWCAEVRPELVSQELDLVTEGQPEVYLARSIDGVPPEEALAVGIEYARTDGTMNRETRCGRWRFAPARELEPGRAEEIARQVGVSSTQDLA